MLKKYYISPEQLHSDSLRLGIKILQSGYKPNFIVGVWRGGATVAIAIHELLTYCGVESDHIAIKASSYTGIDQQASKVQVDGLDYLVNNLRQRDRLLIVDDVFDSGQSIKQIIEDLQNESHELTPEIRVATPYFKPGRNKTERVPDFFIQQTEDWLVFPHELSGLSINEIIEHKPGTEVLAEFLGKNV